MDEVWLFNAHGDIPEAAKDDVNLQAAIIDTESVSTTGVDGVTAELPNGVQLDGFHSVHLSVAGTDVDSPLLSANLNWRPQPKHEVAETAKDIAASLGMDPGDVDAWATQQGPSGRPVNGAQVQDDVPGLSQLSVQYRDLGEDTAVVIVTMVWPRNSEVTPG